MFLVRLLAASFTLVAAAATAPAWDYIWQDANMTDNMVNYVVGSKTDSDSVAWVLKPKNFVPGPGEDYPQFRFWEFSRRISRTQTEIVVYQMPQPDYTCYRFKHRVTGEVKWFCPVLALNADGDRIDWWDYNPALNIPFDPTCGDYTDKDTADWTVTPYELILGEREVD